MCSVFTVITQHDRFHISKTFVKQLEELRFMEKWIRCKKTSPEPFKASLFVAAKFTEPFYLCQTLIHILESRNGHPEEERLVRRNNREIYRDIYKYTFPEIIISIRGENGKDYDYYTVKLAVSKDEYRQIVGIQFGPYLLEADTQESTHFDPGDRFFEEEGFIELE